MLHPLRAGNERDKKYKLKEKPLKIVDVCNFKNSVVIQKETHKWVRRYLKKKLVAI